jgi:hypothetical protein
VNFSVAVADTNDSTNNGAGAVEEILQETPQVEATTGETPIAPSSTNAQRIVNSPQVDEYESEEEINVVTIPRMTRKQLRLNQMIN